MNKAPRLSSRLHQFAADILKDHTLPICGFIYLYYRQSPTYKQDRGLSLNNKIHRPTKTNNQITQATIVYTNNSAHFFKTFNSCCIAAPSSSQKLCKGHHSVNGCRADLPPPLSVFSFLAGRRLIPPSAPLSSSRCAPMQRRVPTRAEYRTGEHLQRACL